MAVAPNTTVKLLKGVNIDISGNHTLYFDTIQNQTQYFDGLVKATYGTYTNNTYQRVGNGTIRLQVLADNIYDCNYMMFQNTNYGNKWFYAFIVGEPRYINDNATEVDYIIDDMQTWYFDYELGDCFVEREHTLTDKVGDNVVPENLDVGELIQQSENNTLNLGVSNVIISYVPNLLYIDGIQWLNGQGSRILNFHTNPVTNDAGVTKAYNVNNSTIIGVCFLSFPISLTTESNKQLACDNIKKAVDTLTEANISGSIIDIYCLAHNIARECGVYYTDTYNSSTGTFTPESRLNPQPNAFTRYVDLNMPTSFKVLTHNGSNVYYTPKNNKLFTYPYSYIAVSSTNGIKKYKWEQFSNDWSENKQVRLQSTAIITPKPICALQPQNYRGITNNFDEQLVGDCANGVLYSIDSFKEWVSQNADSMNTQLTSTAITSAINAVTLPNPALATAGMATSLLSNVFGQVSSVSKAINTPDTLAGSVGNNGLTMTQGRLGFYVRCFGVRGDYAKMIDEYFSMFGYAIRRVKTPNIRNSQVTTQELRPRWNYVKTAGCVIHPKSLSGLPASAEENIAKIYDNGITFWMNGADVGNYSLDNSPRGVG